MAFKADGTWEYEDDTASGRVAAITSKDSALMRQAGAQGARLANRRGLANSTMGIGAGLNAQLAVAVPIASQDASQAYGKNVQQLNNAKDLSITSSNIAAQERERQVAALAQVVGNTQSATAATLTNDKIPAATRAAVQQSFTDQQTAFIAAMQRLYGTNLQWGAR